VGVGVAGGEAGGEGPDHPHQRQQRAPDVVTLAPGGREGRRGPASRRWVDGAAVSGGSEPSGSSDRAEGLRWAVDGSPPHSPPGGSHRTSATNSGQPCGGELGGRSRCRCWQHDTPPPSLLLRPPVRQSQIFGEDAPRLPTAEVAFNINRTIGQNGPTKSKRGEHHRSLKENRSGNQSSNPSARSGAVQIVEHWLE